VTHCLPATEDPGWRRVRLYISRPYIRVQRATRQYYSTLECFLRGHPWVGEPVRQRNCSTPSWRILSLARLPTRSLGADRQYCQPLQWRVPFSCHASNIYLYCKMPPASAMGCPTLVCHRTIQARAGALMSEPVTQRFRMPKRPHPQFGHSAARNSATAFAFRTLPLPAARAEPLTMRSRWFVKDTQPSWSAPFRRDAPSDHR